MNVLKELDKPLSEEISEETMEEIRKEIEIERLFREEVEKPCYIM